ncbi:MAG TPA: prepilin-type N-terminal cleavage/methylation domain-containing protein [Planctomycetota bacterium]|nr:prepilin-type N-terminal cleavage/methylation domain-containing protein [Planctomycetota bacterium]
MRAPRAGFTLIEILVVIAIIGLLMGLVAVTVSRQGQAGRKADCRARIDALGLLVASYADRNGDYPPSRLPAAGVTEGNGINDGIEALVVVFKGKAWAGRRPEERWLGNTDADAAKSLHLADGSSALLEVLDPWGNPLVYISNADYGAEFTYRFVTESGTEDSTVRSALDPLTGAAHQFDSFQILSAGPDGLPGTEDDLANYEIDEPAR